MATFLLIMTLCVISLQFINHWNLSKGRLWFTYRLSIVIYLTYMVIETIIALRDTVQYSMLLFNLINAWGILMATKGIFRLKREAREKVSNQNE